jgi:hypothetical protein
LIRGGRASGQVSGNDEHEDQGSQPAPTRSHQSHQGNPFHAVRLSVT